MIKHLHIKNFMCFKELEIPTLKRVNLIAGKNNSGKTTLLDAIRILKSEGKESVINNILFVRNATKRLNGQNAHEALVNRKSTEYYFSINDLSINKNYRDRFEVTFYSQHRELRLELMQENPYDDLIYVSFNSKFEHLSDLWENIVLTPKEDDIYEILRDTIQPDLIRLDVGREIVRVRLQDTEKPVPLGTLGDGVYRILLIALSLANAQNSILLIDELELGLHYSALEKFIFDGERLRESLELQLEIR